VAETFEGYDWDEVAPLLAERIRAIKDKPIEHMVAEAQRLKLP